MFVHRFMLCLLLGAALPPTTQATDLLELYDRMQDGNPSLKLKELSIDQAEAQKSQALSKLLPQVGASGNLNWNELSQEQQITARRSADVTSRYEGLRGVIQARQAIIDLPSVLNWLGADASVRQSEMELESARLSLSADLVDRYFGVLEAGDQARSLEGEIAHTAGQLNRIRRMRERQLVPITDLYEMEAYARSLETKRIEATNAVAVAVEKLRETAGGEIGTLAPLHSSEFPNLPGDMGVWTRQAVDGHPALLALQHAAEAAKKLIDSSRAQHLPQVALQASETYVDNSGFDNRQQGRYTVGSVGLNLNVPIFSGGAIEAGVRDATARFQIVNEQREVKRREIDRQVRTAWLNAQAGRSRIEASAQEVEARKKSETAQARAYELGVTTVVELLEAKKNRLKSEFEAAKAQYDYIRSLVALRLWAGSLARPDIEEINRWLASKH